MFTYCVGVRNTYIAIVFPRRRIDRVRTAPTAGESGAELELSSSSSAMTGKKTKVSDMQKVPVDCDVFVLEGAVDA